MKSTQFHPKGKKAVPVVVDECSRLTVQSTGHPVTIYHVDEQGKKVGILDVCTGVKKIKLHNVEEILMESEGDFQSILEGPDPMDVTPIVENVKSPLTPVQLVRSFYQNQDNVRALREQADAELTWEEFKDLGDITEGDEFFAQYGNPKTKYEMQAEQLAAAKNKDIERMKQSRIDEKKAQQAKYDATLEAILKEKGYVRVDSQGSTGKGNQGTVNTTDNPSTGQSNNGGKSMATGPAE